MVQDAFLVRVLPRPNAVDQRFATDVVAGQSFFFEHAAFNDSLCRDARVVGSRHPQGFEALHAFPTRDEILNRTVQSMPHVQRAGDVRQRDHDGVLRLIGIGVGIEKALFFPITEPLFLACLGFVGFWNLSRHNALSLNQYRAGKIQHFGCSGRGR